MDLQKPYDTLLEGEIERYRSTKRLSWGSLQLRFPTVLEQTFEADTRAARLQELRLTVPVSILFNIAGGGATDLAWVPDLGFTWPWRMLTALTVLIPVVFGSRFSGRVREGLMALFVILNVMLLGAIGAMSTSSTALYVFGGAALAIVYANTTFPLRFLAASATSAVCTGGLLAQLFTSVHGGSSLTWAMSVEILVAGTFSVLAAYRIERGQRLTYLLSARERMRLSRLAVDNASLVTRSDTDALTGLVNRGCFDRQIAASLANPAEAGCGMALLMLDVDHFKRYNDHYGHVAGDACLRSVAGAISGALRGRPDFAARYGGEEFVIVLFDILPEAAAFTARRVCNSVAALELEHLSRGDGLGVVTVSIGVALMPHAAGASPHEVVSCADKALYVAKRLRNTVECATVAHHAHGRTYAGIAAQSPA